MKKFIIVSALLFSATDLKAQNYNAGTLNIINTSGEDLAFQATVSYGSQTSTVSTDNPPCVKWSPTPNATYVETIAPSIPGLSMIQNATISISAASCKNGTVTGNFTSVVTNLPYSTYIYDPNGGPTQYYAYTLSCYSPSNCVLKQVPESYGITSPKTKK